MQAYSAAICSSEGLAVECDGDEWHNAAWLTKEAEQMTRPDLTASEDAMTQVVRVAWEALSKALRDTYWNSMGIHVGLASLSECGHEVSGGKTQCGCN